MASGLIPRRLRPTELIPRISPPRPWSSMKGQTSWPTRLAPPMNAPWPTVTKWWTTTHPLRIAPVSTRTWPARKTAFARMQLSSTTQSWATWQVAMIRLRLPTTVWPPPDTVPLLIVTPSRITFSSPMTVIVSSPLNLRSWGSPPMTHVGWNRFRAPIVVRPRTVTPWRSLVPGPMVTLGPITQKGPISALAWIRAPGSTMAVGCMAIGLLAIHEHEFHVRFRDHLAVHGRAGEHFAGPGLDLDRLDLQAELVARHDALAELHAVDRQQHRDLRLVLALAHEEHAGELGHRLDLEHAGHD